MEPRVRHTDAASGDGQPPSAPIDPRGFRFAKVLCGDNPGAMLADEGTNVSPPSSLTIEQALAGEVDARLCAGCTIAE